jgi:hypothetical protein
MQLSEHMLSSPRCCLWSKPYKFVVKNGQFYGETLLAFIKAIPPEDSDDEDPSKKKPKKKGRPPKNLNKIIKKNPQSKAKDEPKKKAERKGKGKSSADGSVLDHGSELIPPKVEPHDDDRPNLTV